MPITHCYNCGRPVSKESTIKSSNNINTVLKQTREHIPPDCLFEDSTEEEKKDRIIVPSCFQCNNGYSKHDDVIRNIVGITTDDLKLSNLTDTSFRALNRKPGFKIVETKDGKKGVKFPTKENHEAFIKDFRGLFFNEYKKKLPHEWHVAVMTDTWGINDLQHKNNIAKSVKEYIEENGEYKVSGNEKIFKYCLRTIKFHNHKIIASSLMFAHAIVCIQIYRQTIVALIGATKVKTKENKIKLREMKLVKRK